RFLILGVAHLDMCRRGCAGSRTMYDRREHIVADAPVRGAECMRPVGALFDSVSNICAISFVMKVKMVYFIVAFDGSSRSILELAWNLKVRL
ncbi:MAG: hypothetical protein II180_07690, partial [Proteobacteria bacterium]|nr:hypothetical protein [Pseudomonadota bacterium]